MYTEVNYAKGITLSDCFSNRGKQKRRCRLPLIVFISRFLHLRLICFNVSFLSSVWGENLIVMAIIDVEVHRLVNSIWKTPQRIVNNSSHDLDISRRNVWCFCWPFGTAFPWSEFASLFPRSCENISPTLFSPPRNTNSSNITVKIRFYRQSVFPRRSPFLNCLIIM